MFEAKLYHPELIGNELSVFNSKLNFYGIILICLGLILYLTNKFVFQSDVFFTTSLIVFIFGLILFGISKIQYSFDTDLVSGKINGVLTFLDSKLITDGKEFQYNSIQNFKYIVTDYKGKDSGFFRTDFQFNISNYEVGKGINNWVSFEYNNKKFKFYFFLNNKKHHDEFCFFISELSNKIKIIKAYDF